MTAAEGEKIAWLEADKDYAVGLCEGKLVCRNPKGQTLASVPKWLKDSEVAESLRALSDWLSDHRMECQHTVERWMLGSLLVPREVLHEVSVDPDGETQWLKPANFVVPHPILIRDLEELRELASDLGIQQVIDQLYRPIYVPTEEKKIAQTSHCFCGRCFRAIEFRAVAPPATWLSGSRRLCNLPGL